MNGSSAAMVGNKRKKRKERWRVSGWIEDEKENEKEEGEGEGMPTPKGEKGGGGVEGEVFKSECCCTQSCI